MSNALKEPFGRRENAGSIAIWIVTLAPVLVLWLLAPEMPERIPVFRSLWGEPIAWSQRTPLLVCRVALMNLAFLGIASTLRREAWLARQVGWFRFFSWSGIAIALKAFFENAQTVLLATRFGDPVSPWLYGATIFVVFGFLMAAAALMVRGQLEKFPRVSRRSIALVLLCLIVWAGLAALPMWRGSPQ
jgi:hypothetical protein